MSAELTQLVTAQSIRFVPWQDPMVTEGIDASSDEALVWLTPMLGPTAVLILHRLARYLTAAPLVEFTPLELAGSFGLASGADAAEVSPGFTRAMHRLAMFDMCRPSGEHIEVRMIVPPLAPRHLRRMPAYLLDGYRWAA